MNIKQLAMAGAASALIFSSLAGAAFASTVPTNFPGNTGTSCNAWHGAPGGFGPNSPYYTFVNSNANPAPNVYPSDDATGYDFGQEQGVITGQNNSGYAAYCNQ